jgi:ubiquitin carboxyl-terminal hydrolase 20/33
MVGDCAVEATLADLLGAYLAPEWITDYLCEHCQTRGKVLKRFSINGTSDALVFNLKRFAPTASGSRIKVHRKVSVPLVLDLSSLLGSDTLGTYELCSTVVHDGGMGGGHYMAYARQRRGTTLTREWFWFSDQHFGPVDADEVLNSEPFLLFYERTPIKIL